MMDSIVQAWLHLWLFVAGLSIVTLEWLDYPTVLLWDKILPDLRTGLGM